jgi:hypothetical protein
MPCPYRIIPLPQQGHAVPLRGDALCPYGFIFAGSCSTIRCAYGVPFHMI